MNSRVSALAYEKENVICNIIEVLWGKRSVTIMPS